jgi:protein-S-isoprenylcysteine O-methyltransferase Ste14
MNRKILLRHFLNDFLGILGMAVALFWSAGRLDWWPAWAAILTGAIAALLFILRTILEDRALQAELPGYQDYASRVRSRLFPGVW